MIVDVSTPAQVELLDRTALMFRGAAHARAYVDSGLALAFVAAQGAGAATNIVGWCWGYLLPRPDGSSMAYLHELQVSKGERGRGHGRQLLQTFINAAQGARASRLFLSTGEANHAARSLYESLGGELPAQGATVNYWFPLSPPPA